MDDISLAEGRIAKELEDDIIFGRIGPGEQLREDKLLQRFGHIRRRSRPDVRCGITGSGFHSGGVPFSQNTFGEHEARCA